MKLTDDEWAELSRLLDEALDIPASEQQAWLDALRSPSPGVGTTLRELLLRREAVETNEFLATLPRFEDGVATDSRVAGPYRLLRKLGTGGMGEVWLAQRTDVPLKRLVALKLPRVGLYSRHLIERFERERDILATLIHPNIARLYDAGVAADGQPFLALEYVDGQPLCAYCDARRLDLRQRLLLFLQVLSAVQYAHAHLVVHRDLKPTNVLVTPDGDVRLLDFGIAKLVTEDGAADSELTQLAGPLLTPDYASPEQVSGAPLTVATDVYSLGVILFELLAGERPYRLKRASRSALEEAILEAEVAHPSARCRDPRVAELRGLPPRKLEKALRGDLDTIVLKALKKNAAERYGSVAMLAEDLKRFLASEPISATPDSLLYRSRKFVRRHRAGVAAAGAVAMLLATVVGFYTAQLAAERDRARLAAQKATSVSELLSSLLTGADPFDANAQSKEPTVRAILDAGAERIEKEMGGQPEIQAEMLTVIGRVYQRLGVRDKARSLLEQGLAAGRRAYGPEHENVARSLDELGVLLYEQGDFTAAVSMLEEALTMRRKLLGNDHKDVAVTLVDLGRAYSVLGDFPRAEPMFREALAIRKKVLGDDDHETGTSLTELGLLMWFRGDLDGAESLYRQSLAIYRKTSGDDHPNVATVLSILGGIATDRHDYVAAESLLRQALTIDRRALGADHFEVASTLNRLSNALRQHGRYDEAESASREAIRIAKNALGPDDPDVALYELNLARTYLARRDAAAAEPLLQHALGARERVYPARHWRIGEAKGLLGEALAALARYDEAERLLLDAEALLHDGPGWEGREAAANHLRLAALHDSRSGSEEIASDRAMSGSTGAARIRR